MIRKFTPLFMVLIALGLMGNTDCAGTGAPTADSLAAKETTQMVTEAHRKTGMPNVINFTEKRFVKQLFELRDGEITTYSYIVDLNGGLHFLCSSIGFGIPASVQFSNPERKARADLGQYTGEMALPQAEPNGLFMPEGLSATYVMCADPDGGEPRPVYVEPQIMVSPFALKAIDGYAG